MIASTYTKLEGSAAAQMIRLLEALEEMDDTQNVYSNFDMDANAHGRSGGLSGFIRTGAEGRQNGGLLFGPIASGHAVEKTRRLEPIHGNLQAPAPLCSDSGNRDLQPGFRGQCASHHQGSGETIR